MIGDIRTLIPYLTFKAKEVIYERRWVRVPIARGPCDYEEGDIEATTKDGSSASKVEEEGFEAVALDCAFPDKTDLNPLNLDGVQF